MKGLLAQLEELAWNLPPGPFSLIPDLAEEPVSSSGSRDDSLQGWAAGWGRLLHPHGVAWTSQGGSSSSLGQKWEASSGLTPSVLCPHARGCCSPASGKGTWKSSTLSTTLTQSGCLLPWPFYTRHSSYPSPFYSSAATKPYQESLASLSLAVEGLPPAPSSPASWHRSPQGTGRGGQAAFSTLFAHSEAAPFLSDRLSAPEQEPPNSWQ